MTVQPVYVGEPLKVHKVAVVHAASTPSRKLFADMGGQANTPAPGVADTVTKVAMVVIPGQPAIVAAAVPPENNRGCPDASVPTAAVTRKFVLVCAAVIGTADTVLTVQPV